MKKIYMFIIFMVTLSHVSAQSQQTDAKTSIRFDGTKKGVITMPNLKSSLGTSLDEFTIEFWCKRYREPQLDKWGHYIKIGLSGGKGLGIQVPKFGGFNLVFGNGAGQKPVYRQVKNTAEMSEWTHVAWVYKNAQFHAYINGEAVPCHFGRHDIPTSIELGDTYVVGDKTGTNMRSLRVWKKARTSDQIQQNYNKEVSTNSNLVVHYTMQDNDMPYNVIDTSGNQLDGTISTSSTTKYESDIVTPTTGKGNRIVGYLPYYRMSNVSEEQVSLLTDVVIFSVFPNPNTGEIQISKYDKNGKRIFKHQKGGSGLKQADIERVVSYCDTHGVKAHLCIGGGDYALPFRRLVDNGNAKKFAENLTNLCIELGLDGVDVDWEFPSYSDLNKVDLLFQTLYNHLTPNNLSLSGAFSSYEYSQKPSILSAVRNEPLLDLINVMGYVNTMGGIYRAENVFVKKYKLPKEKVIAGVPFYTFPKVNVMTYNKMVSTAKAAGKVITPEMNSITLNGKVYNYNGVNLVKKKTRYCKNKLGGVMIWEIGQDMPADNDFSLLAAINQVMNEGEVKTKSGDLFSEELSKRDNIMDANTVIYPSNIIDHFNIRLAEQGQYRVEVFNAQGKQVASKRYTLFSNDEQRVPLIVPSGVYIVMIYDDTNKLIHKSKLIR
ncbi:T9SS type A sorting domain-containing protein [Halosquirtibacter xylanolyticus]|uniref:glycosyl hydrolase family 18 protein n=1 Tax=Halosquirtibacter xylanolyticus TaxID=3374599 RepID=UPI003749CC55|nr:T9SS type A sorting domain-containing protein [Prolixibacteraceae bacterium]